MISQASLGWQNWLWPLKKMISGIIEACPLDLFFWESLSRRAQETTVPEFANHLASERAAMWYALGIKRTCWHHDLTFFSAIQRKIAFPWAWPAFAKGACGHHLFLPFLWICGSLSDCQQVHSCYNLKIYPASAQSFSPSLHHTTNIHHLFGLLCDQLVTRGAVGKIWLSFGYRSARAPSLQVTRAGDWMNSLLRSTKARPGSNTRYCMGLSLQHSRTPANRCMVSVIWATRCKVLATHLGG